jgi:NADH:ubiquinone oxidoreductase subunit
MNYFISSLFGKCIGSDSYGNNYFEGRWSGPQGKPRRWVSYKTSEDDPSGIPSEWHGWIHCSNDILPKHNMKRHFWQKDHMANGIINNINVVSKKILQDYQSWTPS